MNLVGIKELIAYNFNNIRFVEKPTTNELVIIKNSQKRKTLVSITQNVIKNTFTIRFNGFEGNCYNVSSLLDFIELIN